MTIRDGKSFPIIGRKRALTEREQFLKDFEANITERYEENLEQALKRCYGDASKSLYSQARAALVSLFNYSGPAPAAETLALKSNTVLTVNAKDVTGATAKWYAQGLSPATINKRLNCLSKMGVSVKGLRVKDPKKLKWYLKEDMRSSVMSWCHGNNYDSLASLIGWTTRTGLRIEESLRLTWDSFGETTAGPYMTVPGTKTSTSQATLPLSREANGLIRLLFVGRKMHTDGPFPWTYEQYQTQWDHVRQHFGWKDDPTATLKALRRSAARYLHVDCNMPLHMVQQYLRHESMDTTLEYLRLTGGYGTEEMRRFLK